MARVHRIGQTRPVHVYRFCSSGTVEERVQLRAEKKLYLDQMVNRGATAGAPSTPPACRVEDAFAPTRAWLGLLFCVRPTSTTAASLRADGGHPVQCPSLLVGAGHCLRLHWNQLDYEH